MAPHSRISCPWAMFGEDGSMKNVIYRLWEQYAELNALEFPACIPFAELRAGGAWAAGSGVHAVAAAPMDNAPPVEPAPSQ